MTTQIIDFRIIFDDEDLSSLCEELKECLQEHSSSFSHALISDLSHIDQRAGAFEGVEIVDVAHKHDNSFCFHYSYEYYINNGCSDFNVEGTGGDVINFTLGRSGAIEIHIPEITNARSSREYED